MLSILTKIPIIIPQNTTANSNALILKTKTFPAKFYGTFRIEIKFWTFSKNFEPHSLSIFEIIYHEKGGYLIA